MARRSASKWVAAGLAAVLIGSALAVAPAALPPGLPIGGIDTAEATQGSFDRGAAPVLCTASQDPSGGPALLSHEWPRYETDTWVYGLLWVPSGATVNRTLHGDGITEVPGGGGLKVWPYAGIQELPAAPQAHGYGHAPDSYSWNPADRSVPQQRTFTLNSPYAWTNNGASRYMVVYTYLRRLGDTPEANQFSWSYEWKVNGGNGDPPPLPCGLSDLEALGGENPASPQLICPCTGWAGQPIDTRSGNFWEDWTDFHVVGRGPGLTLARTYNSADAGRDGPFGHGWSSTIDAQLSEDPATGLITVVQESGARVFFVEQDGVYLAPPRTLASLEKHSDGSWSFVRRGGETLRFDAQGRLTELADRNGEAVTFHHDPGTGNLDFIEDPGGHRLSFTWQADRIVSVSDSRSESDPRTVLFTYTSSGDLETATDVTGGIWHFTYDTEHRMLSFRNPRHTEPAKVVENHYDAEGRVDWQEDELDRRTSFFYNDPADGATRVQLPDGDQRVDWYVDGRRERVTAGYGTAAVSETEFGYDAAFQLISRTDPNDNAWTYGHDEAGNRTYVRDPLGRESSAAYNEFDQPVQVVDGEGIVTSFVYDASGNLLSTTAAEGTALEATTTFLREDPAHPEDVTRMVDALGKEWLHTYDDSTGQLLSTVDPEGNTTSFTYNSLAWLISTISGRGNEAGAVAEDHTAHFTYDDAGRVVTGTNAEDETTTTSYDASGLVEWVEDNDGERTTYAYDDAGQLVKEVRPDTTEVVLDHWPDGALKSRTESGVTTWQYAYDPLGRLVSAADALGRVTAHGYDAAGNRVWTQQPGGDCAAGVGCITYVFDDASQLVAVDYSDPATADVSAIAYDGAGRRTSVTDGTGTSVWDWDELGRLEAHTDGAGLAVDYGYDLAGNLTSVQAPGQVSPTTRSYDDAGRLVSVSDPSAGQLGFDWDADSNLSSVAFPSGADDQDSYSYDRVGRIVGISYSDDGTDFGAVSYARDAEGLLASETSTGLPATPGAGVDFGVGYDTLDQLVEQGGLDFGYDPLRNLTRTAQGVSQAFDPAGQLCWTSPSGTSGDCSSVPTDATTFGYDERGNRISSTSADGTPTTYSYDQANRLWAVTTSGEVPTAPPPPPPEPEPYLVDSYGEGTSWKASNWTSTFPDLGQETGDLLVAVFMRDRTIGGSAYLTPPSGWETGWQSTPDSGRHRFEGYYTIYEEGVTQLGPAWTFPGGADYSLWFGVIRGANPADPVSIASDYSPAGSVWPSTSVTEEDGRVLAFMADESNAAGGPQSSYLPRHWNSDPIRWESNLSVFVDDEVWTGPATTPSDLVATWPARSGRAVVVVNADPAEEPDPEPVSETTYFTYDSDGVRTSKTSPDGTLIHYVWDRSGPLPLLLEERVGSAVTRYVYGPFGSPVTDVQPDGSARYYHRDQIGSTRALTDSTGAPIATFSYDAYGAATASTGEATTPFGWVGEYRDEETGLVYLRARYYDPATGQFISRDPLVHQTLEPFGYTGNSPLGFTDPSGLCWGPGCWVDDAWNATGGRAVSAVSGVGQQDVANFAGGVLNTITFGNERRINTWLGQEDHVRRNSGWYTTGEVVGVAVDVRSVSRVGFSASSRFPRFATWLSGTSSVGSRSTLFGRSYHQTPGLLNRGPIRLGWGWNAAQSREVFRLSCGTPRSWTHGHWDLL